MVNRNTRNENILEIFLTTNHTLVNSVEILPDISDHDIILTSFNAIPTLLKQKPRTCHIYSKSNWLDFKSYMIATSDQILQGADILVKLKIETGISKFVPVKTIGTNKSVISSMSPLSLKQTYWQGSYRLDTSFSMTTLQQRRHH